MQNQNDPTRALFQSTSDEQQPRRKSDPPSRSVRHAADGPVSASDYSIVTNATPARMLELIQNAKQRWLAKTELHEILSNAAQYRLAVSHVQVLLPPSGSLVLYDKTILRRFRKDGHEWVSKRSSNTTREDRSRLKVHGTTIDCNYAHGVQPRSFHRRIYQLHGSSLVLVHYLDDEQDGGAGDPSDSGATPRTKPSTPAGSTQASPLIRRHGSPVSGPGTPSSAPASSALVTSLSAASTATPSSPYLPGSSLINAASAAAAAGGGGSIASEYQVNMANNCWFGVRSYCPPSAPSCGGSDLLICTNAPTVVALAALAAAAAAAAAGDVVNAASRPGAGHAFPSAFPDVWTLQRSSGDLSAIFPGAGNGKSFNPPGYSSSHEAFFLCVRFGHTAVRAELLSPSCIRVKVPPYGPATAQTMVLETQSSAGPATLQLCLVNQQKFSVAATAGNQRRRLHVLLQPAELGDTNVYRSCSHGHAFKYTADTSLLGQQQQQNLLLSRSKQTLQFGAKRKRVRKIPASEAASEQLLPGGPSLNSNLYASLGGGDGRIPSIEWDGDFFQQEGLAAGGRAVAPVSARSSGPSATSQSRGFEADDDMDSSDHDHNFQQGRQETVHTHTSTSTRAQLPLFDDRSLEKMNEGDLTRVCTSLLDRTLRHLQSSAFASAGSPADGPTRMLQEVNRLDEDGLSLLHYACLCQHFPLAKKLLESRANPDLCSTDGQTPLLMAASAGALAVVEVLLEHGADASLTDAKDGVSPLQVAAVNGFREIVAAIRKSGNYGAEVPDDAHLEGRLRGRDATFVDEDDEDDDDFHGLSDDDEDEDNGHNHGRDSKGTLGMNLLHERNGAETAGKSSTMAFGDAGAGPRGGFPRAEYAGSGLTRDLQTRPNSRDTVAAPADTDEDDDDDDDDDAVQQRLLVSAFQTMTLREKCALSLADPAKEKFLFGSGAVGGDGSDGGETPSSVDTAMGRMSAADRADVYADVEMIQKNIRSWLLRRSYVKLRDCSLQVQAVARGKKARQGLRQKEQAATTLSKEMKKFMAKRKFQKLKTATQTLKSAWRKKKVHELTRMRKLISAAMVIQKSMLAWRGGGSGNVADSGDDAAGGASSSSSPLKASGNNVQLARTAASPTGSSTARSASVPVQKRILRHHRKATQPVLSTGTQSELSSGFLTDPSSDDVRALFSHQQQRHGHAASIAAGGNLRGAAEAASEALSNGGLSSDFDQRRTSSRSPLLSPGDFEGMDLFPGDLDGLDGGQDLEQSTSPLGSSSLGAFAQGVHHHHQQQDEDHDGAVTEDDDQFLLSGFSEDGEE